MAPACGRRWSASTRATSATRVRSSTWACSVLRSSSASSWECWAASQAPPGTSSTRSTACPRDRTGRSSASASTSGRSSPRRSRWAATFASGSRTTSTSRRKGWPAATETWSRRQRACAVTWAARWLRSPRPGRSWAWTPSHDRREWGRGAASDRGQGRARGQRLEDHVEAWRQGRRGRRAADPRVDGDLGHGAARRDRARDPCQGDRRGEGGPGVGGAGVSELPGVRVKVQESANQVIYTDAVLINGNPLGFVLNFGQWAPEDPGLVRIYTRVGMSPNHMKLLSQLLTQNVAAYEARFGEVAVTEDRAAAAHRIGFDAAAQATPPKV